MMWKDDVEYGTHPDDPKSLFYTAVLGLASDQSLDGIRFRVHVDLTELAKTTQSDRKFVYQFRTQTIADFLSNICVKSNSDDLLKTPVEFQINDVPCKSVKNYLTRYANSCPLSVCLELNRELLDSDRVWIECDSTFFPSKVYKQLDNNSFLIDDLIFENGTVRERSD